ncbi:MAG TPA: trypco2 family protein [Allocoleopsis sp.]
MPNQPSQSIGLAELIQQVKKELLSTVPGQSSDAPILFVESVELELKVTVSREGTGGVKIDVLSFGGGEVGGNLKREDVHTVKVNLSPLFDKERLMEFYQTLHSDKVPTTVKQSVEALLKGEEEDLSNQF